MGVAMGGLLWCVGEVNFVSEYSQFLIVQVVCTYTYSLSNELGTVLHLLIMQFLILL